MHGMARASLVAGERIATPVLPSEGLYTREDATVGHIKPIVNLILPTSQIGKISIRKKFDIGGCHWW